MTDVLEREKRVVSIVLGEYHATADPKTVVSTVLGSCIAACLCDPEAGVGGMNHFMLPDGDACSAHDQLRYGVNAMELLINELLRSGARRQKLEAKLFGGAHLVSGLNDIGAANIAFIGQFLEAEQIACVSRSLGGHQARRIRFWPVRGKAQQRLLPLEDIATPATMSSSASQMGDGRVELF